MQGRSAAVTGSIKPFYVPQYYKPRQMKVNVAELEEIPSRRDENNCRRYLFRAAMTLLCCTIVAAGVVPALVIVLTQKPASTSTNSNDEVSSVTSTSWTSASGISSISSSATVPAGVASSSSSSTTVPAEVASTSPSSTSTSSSSSGTTSVLSSTSSTAAVAFTASGNVAAATTSYYGYEDVYISCSSILTNINIEITVQKTVNATYNDGTYSTFWGGTVSQSYVDNGEQIIYTWTIVSGQTITCSGGPYQVEAQFHLSGTSQTTSDDTYVVIGMSSDGLTSTQSGHF